MATPFAPLSWWAFAFHTTRLVLLARLAQWESFDFRRGDPGSIPGWCNFFVFIIFLIIFFFDVRVVILLAVAAR